MIIGGKLFLIGEFVRITDGALRGLTGIVSGFSSHGKPILFVDGYYNVMLGYQGIEAAERSANNHLLN